MNEEQQSEQEIKDAKGKDKRRQIIADLDQLLADSPGKKRPSDKGKYFTSPDKIAHSLFEKAPEKYLRESSLEELADITSLCLEQASKFLQSEPDLIITCDSKTSFTASISSGPMDGLHNGIIF